MEITITAADVNKLRKITGAGLMDCKKALVESNGDFDSAIDYLRKKGQKVAAKRADREATEGAVIALTTDDNKTGVVVHISCETDFVAKNEEFVNFAKGIATLALNNHAADKAAVLDLDYEGQKVADRILEQVGKIGEKIEVANYRIMEGEAVVPYIHAGNKIGVLTVFNKPSTDAIFSLGKDISMQIAAMSPLAVDESGIPEATRLKELEIGRELAIAEGKPEKIVDRIAEGKLQKFYKERTLLHQQYVKDSSMTVGQVVKSTDSDLQVTDFVRVSLGE